MRLTIDGLRDGEALEAAGVVTPAFDVAAMQASGRERPRWLHIGPGNIFRVFLARIAEDLLASGRHWPIAVVAPRRPTGLDVQLAAHDLLTLSVTLRPDGSRDLRAVAGVSEGLAVSRPDDRARFLALAADPGVSLVSLTITEKGYAVADSAGDLQEAVTAASGPRARQGHTMALVASFLLARYEAGGAPITLLSCDNFSHNGDKLRDSVTTIARGWARAGSADEGFPAWIEDPSRVAFPISVIDKITPRPSEAVAEALTGLGFTDMGLQAPDRTPLAGFVNTEPTEYLIIEDAFAGERPPLEEAGAQIVAREVCDRFESMKVATCLNPLHTALAIAGCLLRMPTIDAEMRDPALAALVHRLGWEEGLPVVSDPGVVSPESFLTEVLQTRFTNPYLPDDPARIAMDTSQKMPIRFGQTLLRYRDRGLDMGGLRSIPLVIALWCRYLTGIADDGAPFEPSSDPLYDELHAHVAGIRLGEPVDARRALAPILSDPELFGLDLTATPVAGSVEALFSRLISGPGAVRATLDKETLPQ
ncbi:mannitol dehydrogenase family protein [Actinomyces israelii]|uniref:mannitol dehydrogenase family protein n=1 Tax=Actinomyces israelii TaxID=1659 RepID=UPI0005BB27E2|nr:mannitol dehydrogenase family protein [Actinomyces israelii]